MTRLTLLARVATCTLAFASVAWAGPNETAPTAAQSWLNERIAQLDADGLEEREAAQRELMLSRSLTLSQLEEALRAQNLSPEQRARLETVAAFNFQKCDRAALGISWNMNSERSDGLEISGPTQARTGGSPFDSAKFLQAGDVIVEMDGVPVVTGGSVQSGWDRCRTLITSYCPGEEVTLNILRDDEPMEFKLRMGRLADLDPFGRRDPGTDLIKQAWNFRMARLNPHATRIDAGISAAVWLGLCDELDVARTKAEDDLRSGRVEVPDEPALVAAGRGGRCDVAAVQPFEENPTGPNAQMIQKRIAELMEMRRVRQAELARVENEAVRQKYLADLKQIDQQILQLNQRRLREAVGGSGVRLQPALQPGKISK